MVKPIIGDVQAQPLNDNFSELSAKTSNPLGAMESSGTKIPKSLLSDEILQAMAGNTPIIVAKGLEVNSGVVYPLDNIIRDGVLNNVDEQAKKTILYTKVIGAKRGKYYVIEYIANGVVLDDKEQWGVSIVEYTINNFGSNSANGRRVLQHYRSDLFPKPTTSIVNRVFHFKNELLTIVVTYDTSKITGKFLNLTDSVYGTSKGCVIHENNYIYDEKTGYLVGNQGITYPLKNTPRNGVSYNEIEEINNAILDCKVFNARPGKIYRIEWLGNGTTAWGDPNYSVYLYEYDPDFTNKRVIFERYNQNTPAPKRTIETQTISNNSESVILTITIDYSKLSKTSYPLNFEGDGYGYIIDASCYYLETKNQSIVEVPGSQVAVLKNGRKISIKFKYDASRNMIIDFDKLGINELTHIKRFYFETSSIMDNNFPSLPPVDQLATDWVSPYGIIAKNNTVSSFGGTVGGNHGTVDSGGFATARHVETKVYADDKELKDGESVSGSKIVIVATHMIAASNTINVDTGVKRDSVKEIVTYTISPRHIQVSVLLEAFENVEFNRYTGLQSTSGLWGKYLYFMEDTTKTVFDIEKTTPINSGLFPASKANRFVLKKDSNVLMVYMKHELGIKTDYIAENEPMIFLSDMGKVYAHLVKKKNLALNTGNIAYYAGGYVFSPDLSKTVVESAYSYYENGNKIYVLDFFQAGEVFFVPDATDLNREIEVIQKSSTITIDNFVTGKGVKVTSTGYGQVFFKMK
ncbi:hypothetical protein QUF88_19205 [Bacillus sp. DX1.1]|uniref:hypothetical protein n=1 Tax=unclassified Bacillus (in: firmicutes) TaxID=185979 RepID=UPI00257026AD|nr:MULTISPECIES: hypothetical protein [unclassified Bacillus (in: firmicutes)]MDM5155840.1 hypothetical protein [Bacillus sp. DX1.1]WJE80136.1 hypothetical protein QRE67_16735 [Bacillus sp. DX3.1]